MKRSMKDSWDAVDEMMKKGRHHVDVSCDNGIMSVTGHREFCGLSSFDEFQSVSKPNILETLLGITLESKVCKSVAKMQRKCNNGMHKLIKTNNCAKNSMNCNVQKFKYHCCALQSWKTKC